MSSLPLDAEAVPQARWGMIVVSAWPCSWQQSCCSTASGSVRRGCHPRNGQQGRSLRAELAQRLATRPDARREFVVPSCHALPELRPLGGINRIREAVYRAMVQFAARP